MIRSKGAASRNVSAAPSPKLPSTRSGWKSDGLERPIRDASPPLWKRWAGNAASGRCTTDCGFVAPSRPQIMTHYDAHFSVRHVAHAFNYLIYTDKFVLM